MASVKAVVEAKTALARALDHVVIASNGPASFAPYCHFQPGWIVGYDGIIAAGCRTEEHLSIAPNTDLFRHAVARAGSPYSITAMPDGTAVVRGHKVRASIPSMPLTEVPNVLPDRPQYPVSEPLKRALVDCSKLSTNKAVSVLAASLHLRCNSVVATDGTTIVEAWHGCNLPGSVLLPREFADALNKVKHVPTSLGASMDTLTVWFGEDVWLRTNIYKEAFPDTDVFFARIQMNATELRPIPRELLQGIEALKPFREDDYLAMTEYGLNTKATLDGASATFEHFMLWRGLYPTAGLRMAATYGSHIAFASDSSYWYGSTMRGVTDLRGA